jgi:hypothetical protein
LIRGKIPYDFVPKNSPGRSKSKQKSRLRPKPVGIHPDPDNQALEECSL